MFLYISMAVLYYWHLSRAPKGHFPRPSEELRLDIPLNTQIEASEHTFTHTHVKFLLVRFSLNNNEKK